MRLEQATADAVHATLDADKANLGSALAVATQTIAAQDVGAQTLQATLSAVSDELDFYEATGPIVTFVEPPDLQKVEVGEEQALVIIASDPMGVDRISITIGDGPVPNEPIELLVDPPGSNPQSYKWTHRWTPENAGFTRITVWAWNSDNKQGRQSDEIVVDVQAPPTSTPTSTATATATPIPTATATSES
jgi:hypothetical protein